MKPEDEQPPSEEELREAEALAAALEQDARGANAEAGPPGEVLETAALLRHARTPLAVPPAHEPIAAAQSAEALDARRARGRRRVARWITTSLVVPAVAAAFLLVRPTSERAPALRSASPAPSPSLLAAQAAATRGGSDVGAALARLDLEMRAYRRQYHEGLRRGSGSAR
jgi:hypothetical protein